MAFVYSSGRRYGKAVRVFQVLEGGAVRVGVASQVTVVEESVQTFENMDAFIDALGSTTGEPKRKIKRRKRRATKDAGDKRPAASKKK